MHRFFFPTYISVLVLVQSVWTHSRAHIHFIICGNAKQENMVIRMCLDLNKVIKVKLARTEFFPFLLEENNRPGAEKENS